MQREPVIKKIWQTGEVLAADVNQLINGHGLQDHITLNGLAPWKILCLKDHPNASKFELNTFIIKEMLASGVLVNGSHNICFEHTLDDIHQTVEAYDQTFSKLSKNLRANSLRDELDVDVILPVFKVR